MTPEIKPPLQERIGEHLALLYGAERGHAISKRLGAILAEFRQRSARQPTPTPIAPLSQRDAILITYGDQFSTPGEPPLEMLHKVLTETLEGSISGLHILPFFPFSSDDGFAVIDYAAVNRDLGTWADIERLGHDFRLMVDAVVNHVSKRSEWFQRFLAEDPHFANWFITVAPGTDISSVVRPRALPLLHSYRARSGDKLIWTTFSEDQVDLNYAHPDVLLKMIEILLMYVQKGAQIIRLDAVAYLWKELGTPCIHLPQTHQFVKLLRAVTDAVCPGVIWITETNVPHEDNISYFGSPLPGTDATDESQMVYQFPLPPLVMHSILSGSASVLSEWAASLTTPALEATFFNFTASHDGIGLTPARGLLSNAQIQALVDTALAHGGRVSYQDNPNGESSVYELNISYFDALSDPAADEPQGLQVRRFICSQAIMLALAGVPGIYVHSLLGSRSWHEGVAQTCRNRTINRRRFRYHELEQELADPGSLRHQVYRAYRHLLRVRAGEPAFHPFGSQHVIRLSDAVFAVLRTSPGGESRVLCLHNVSSNRQAVQLAAVALGGPSGTWHDLLGLEGRQPVETGSVVDLPPYGQLWLHCG